MRAIVLAAGVGRRFGPATSNLPKCLIPLGLPGRTLLSRYLESFRALGIRDVVIVCGHRREKIIRACVRDGAGLDIRFVVNRRFRRGSIVSLYAASRRLDSDVLIMDADVYFPAEALRRLLRSRQKSAFLLDRRSTSAGEEMMVMSKGGRLAAVSKKTVPGLRIVGEATGILKLSAADAAELRKILSGFIRRKILDVEYEETYTRLLRDRKVGFVDVGGLFWREMDFPEDLRAILRRSAQAENPSTDKYPKQETPPRSRQAAGSV